MGIYCIENMVNNKRYIGQSNNIYARFYNHKWCLENKKHSNSYLQRAWDKYGKDNFRFYVIEASDINSIDEREQYFIKFYNTLIDEFGYNLDSGGNKNKRHSEITKEKIRKSNTGKTNSTEVRKKISDNRKGKCVGNKHFMYGKHVSDETRRKLSEKITGMFAGEKHYDAKSVICINTGEVFNTIKSAAQHYKTIPANISKCCVGERHYSGTLEDGSQLQWAYYDEQKTYELKKYERGTNAKALYQYDLNNKFIARFKSARDAERQTGIGYKMISRVCKGERPHTHGYIFKFEDVA